MKVGDLIVIKSEFHPRPDFETGEDWKRAFEIKNDYSVIRQKFLIIEIRDKEVVNPLEMVLKQFRAVSIPDGFKTRWTNIYDWEVISESR